MTSPDPTRPSAPAGDCACEGEFPAACGPECGCYHHDAHHLDALLDEYYVARHSKDRQRLRATRDALAPRQRISMPSKSGDQGQGHPVLFGFSPTSVYVTHPDGGGYPIGFLDRAYMTLGVTDPTKVLHLCSGSMRIGVTVDIRPEMTPDIVADCRAVPLPDESFDWIMADPPYSEEYAANLYGTAKDYPKPGQILREAARLLRPGGRVGLLHFQVPMHRPPLSMVGVWGVSTGAGYAIRAWTVFEKAHATLGLVP